MVRLVGCSPREDLVVQCHGGPREGLARRPEMRSLMPGVVLLLVACSTAETAGEPQVAGSPEIQRMAWLTGRWVNAEGGEFSEETWSPPYGNSLIGMWRWVREGRAVLFELLTLTAEPEGLVLRLRHFDRQGVGREEKDAPLVLREVRSGRSEATFEGVKDGRPLRITYRRDGRDALTGIVETGGAAEGEAERQVYRFRRAAL